MAYHRDTEDLFDDWAARGRGEGMERTHSFAGLQALRQIPIQPGQRLLDLGCGNGWATRWLRAQAGEGGEAVGVDVAALMLDRARAASVGIDGLAFERSAFDALPFAGHSFDHAFSMEALYYAVALDPALLSIARVLKPGGTLTVCVDYFEENPYSAPWPERVGVPMIRLSQAGWCGAFEAAGFAVQACFRCLDSRPIGPSCPADERAARHDFATRIGTLAIRGAVAP